MTYKSLSPIALSLHCVYRNHHIINVNADYMGTSGTSTGMQEKESIMAVLVWIEKSIPQDAVK